MMLIEESKAADENKTKIQETGERNGLIETVFFSLTLFPGYSLSDTNV